jgi:putative ABC transport system substrate-binding protein
MTFCSRRSVLGLALALWSARALAEDGSPATIPHIGVIYPGFPPANPGGALDHLRQGLRDLGYVEGKTIVLDVLYDEYQPRRAGEHAATLVAAKVDLIVAGGTDVAVAARQVTRTLPIVMAVSADPVAAGLVASLARPGGNVTGLSNAFQKTTARRLQLLVEAVPGLQRVAMMVDLHAMRGHEELAEGVEAGRSIGVQVLPVEVAAVDQFDAAFATARNQHAQGVMLGQSVMFALNWSRLAALALAARLPSIAGPGDIPFARAGGLMTYGTSIPHNWQRAATYVQKILQGAAPGDLPVEQSNHVELIINRGTADALGLKLPPQLLLLADEVIQ